MDSSKQRKVKYISLREPGGSKNSELIRKLILNKKSDLHIFSDLLLYLAARNENINKIIKKNYIMVFSLFYVPDLMR